MVLKIRPKKTGVNSCRGNFVGLISSQFFHQVTEVSGGGKESIELPGRFSGESDTKKSRFVQENEGEMDQSDSDRLRF